MAKPAEEGHNSGVKAADLKEFARRLVHLEDAKAEAMEPFRQDIAELKSEVKSAGYSAKLLSKAVAIQRMEESDREILGLYCDALGAFG